MQRVVTRAGIDVGRYSAAQPARRLRDLRTRAGRSIVHSPGTGHWVGLLLRRVAAHGSRRHAFLVYHKPNVQRAERLGRWTIHE